jgi:hypothetical protein
VETVHILVSHDGRRTHRGHPLRGGTIDKAPTLLRVRGWSKDGDDEDRPGVLRRVAKALKLDSETVSGMLSGLKLTPFADNAQFYGLAGGHAHYETLFDTAFVIWRKKGLVTRPVDAKDGRRPFISAGGLSGKVDEPKIAAAPSKDRAIINKQIEVHSPRADRSCRARSSSSTRSARR